MTPKEQIEDWILDYPVYDHSIEDVREYMTKAFNLGLQVASENVEADFEPMGWLAEQHMEDPFIAGEDYEIGIHRNSILKHKL